MSTDPVSAQHQPPHPEFRHDVVVCTDDAGLVDRACSLVDDGVAQGQAVLVAMTAEHEDVLRRSLGPLRRVRFVDGTELARNPSRIIPAITEFVLEAEGVSCRFVGEARWPGRSRAEIDEVARHELLVDLALSSHPVVIVSLVGPSVAPPGDLQESATADLDTILSPERWPLEPPPPGTASFRFDDDLSVARDHVQDYAEHAGMDAQHADDLVLAVNEVISNSVRYGGGGGDICMWTDHGVLVCEIRDEGVITDPLVGRRPPGPDLEAPGLWLVNQLCDLVQVRSGPGGTRTRLRVRCGASPAPWPAAGIPASG